VEDGLYKTETGVFVIDVLGDGSSISADAVYLMSGTSPWTPGKAIPLGLKENINPAGFKEVLVKNGNTYVAHNFNDQGLVQGKALTLKGNELLYREFFYDLDLNGDGVTATLLGVPTGWELLA